jgi:FkbM family methyltransferase
VNTVTQTARAADVDLRDILAPRRLTEVVDVGANPIDGDPPYLAMLQAGLCRVTGFEPQLSALHELTQAQGPLERYLPWALGDGGMHTLHVCAAPGMTSLLAPDAQSLALFEALQPLAEVRERIAVQTRRLDDIAEIAHLDFLKIDVQGSELAVFRAGRARLAQAVMVQTEVSFVTLYKEQPTQGEIDQSEVRAAVALLGVHATREVRPRPHARPFARQHVAALRCAVAFERPGRKADRRRADVAVVQPGGRHFAQHVGPRQLGRRRRLRSVARHHVDRIALGRGEAAVDRIEARRARRRWPSCRGAAEARARVAQDQPADGVAEGRIRRPNGRLALPMTTVATGCCA